MGLWPARPPSQSPAAPARQACGSTRPVAEAQAPDQAADAQAVDQAADAQAPESLDDAVPTEVIPIPQAPPRDSSARDPGPPAPTSGPTMDPDAKALAVGMGKTEDQAIPVVSGQLWVSDRREPELTSPPVELHPVTDLNRKPCIVFDSNNDPMVVYSSSSGAGLNSSSIAEDILKAIASSNISYTKRTGSVWSTL